MRLKYAPAGIGYFTLLAAAMGARVVAFEPTDFNLRYLITSVEKSGLAQNITLYQNAAGNAAGKVCV